MGNIAETGHPFAATYYLLALRLYRRLCGYTAADGGDPLSVKLCLHDAVPLRHFPPKWQIYKWLSRRRTRTAAILTLNPGDLYDPTTRKLCRGNHPIHTSHTWHRVAHSVATRDLTKKAALNTKCRKIEFTNWEQEMWLGGGLTRGRSSER